MDENSGAGQKDGDNFAQQLQAPSNGDFLPFSLIAKLPNEWQRDMAAMFFNVEQKDAFEALLQSPIETALKSGNAKEIQRLESNPGFPEILERVIACRYKTNDDVDQETLFNTTRALSALTRECFEYSESRKMVFEQALHVRSWKQFDADAGKCIVQIAQYAPERSVAPLLGSISLSRKKENTGLWCEGLATSLPYFVEKYPNLVSTRFAINADSEEYLQIVCTLANIDPNFPFHYIVPSSPQEQIIQTLASTTWDLDSATAVRVLVPIHKEWDWPILTQEIAKDLGSVDEETDYEPGHMVDSLEVLLGLADAELRDRAVSSVSTQGGFRSLEELMQAKETEAAAYLAALLIGSDDPLEITQPKNVRVAYGYQTQPLSKTEEAANNAKQEIKRLIQGEGSPALVEKVRSVAMRLWSMSEWRSIAENNPSRLAFVKSLAASASDKGQAAQLPVDELIDHADFWQDLIGSDHFMRLATEAAKLGDLQRALEAREYAAKFDPLYLVAFEAGDSKNLRGVVSTGLLSIPEDEWIENLENGSERLPMAIALSKKGLQLGQAFENALFKEAERALSDESCEEERIDYKALTAVLGEVEKRRLYHRLANAFATSTTDFHDFIPCWGDILTDALLETGPEMAKERMILTIENANPTELKWLVGLLKRWKKNTRKNQQVRSQLRTAADDGNNAAKLSLAQREALAELESAIGKTK